MAVAAPITQAAWEAFLLARRAQGQSIHGAMIAAINAADERRAQAVFDALRKGLRKDSKSTDPQTSKDTTS